MVPESFKKAMESVVSFMTELHSTVTSAIRSRWRAPKILSGDAMLNHPDPGTGELLSLREFRVQNGATAEMLADGSVRVETCAQQWGYSLVFPVRREALERLGDDRSIVVGLAIAVHRGRVGVACLDGRSGKFATGETFVAPADRDTEVKLLLSAADAATSVVVRNVEAGGECSTATVRQIAAIPARALAEGERRRLAARNFPYWHYEHDLGHGAKTVPSRPEITKWHALRHRIIFGILEGRFGSSLAGKRCIDFACCSGFWSFALAERGASKVVALDKNGLFIEQAEFVRRCRQNPVDRSIEFLHRDILEHEPEPKGFDIVLCLGLMYHLTDPVGAARRLFQATRDLALVDSAVSDREGAVLELGDGRKYSCCSENEFAFVPTREALIRILNHVGFSKVEPWLPVDPDVLGAYGPSGHRVLLLAQR